MPRTPSFHSVVRPRVHPLVPGAVLALTACLAAGSAGAQGSVTDATAVARAGTDAVTRKALYGHMARYYGRVGLEQLITRSLVRQEAARYKLDVPEADLAARTAELKKAAGMRFEEALNTEGITEEAWKERTRYGMLAERVLARKWPVRDEDLVRLSLRYARYSSERQAKVAITEARSTPFDILVLRDSLDKENAGQILPEKFLRVDRPDWYKRGEDLRPGQVSRDPIPSGEFWLVVKLEGRYGPETLSAKEREQAVQRINAYRMAFLLPTLRKRYPPSVKTPGDQLFAGAESDAEAVMAQVGGQSITRKDLTSYLATYFGKTALEQLLERSILTQEARKQNVAVSDAELAARVADFQKNKDALARVLQADGITEEAWKERLRYQMLAEKVVAARSPVKPEDLTRMTVRYLRLGAKKDADAVIQALRQGATVEQIQARLGGRVRDGFIQPRAFLRVDNPTIYKMIEDAKLRDGGVLPNAVELAGGWVAMRLEARFGPETLSAKEREDAVRRTNATRAGQVLDAVRRTYKVEYVLPLKSLVAEAGA